MNDRNNIHYITAVLDRYLDNELSQAQALRRIVQLGEPRARDIVAVYCIPLRNEDYRRIHSYILPELERSQANG